MKRPYGTGSIYKITAHGRPAWRIQRSISHNGTRTYITGTGASPEQAQARLDRNLRRYHEHKNRASKGTPLIKAVEDYHETHDLTPNAHFRERGLIQNHIKPNAHGITVEKATEQQIHAILSKIASTPIARTGQPLGTTGRRTIYYILKTVFSRAEKDGQIKPNANPMRYLKPPKRQVVQDNNLLSTRMEDWKKLHQAITTSTLVGSRVEQEYLTEGYIPGYARWILALLGLRQSERLGLTWDCFSNLKAGQPGVIEIHQQLYNDAEAGRIYIRPITKNQRGKRLIPISRRTTNNFINLKIYQEQFSEKHEEYQPAHPGLLFTTKSGGFIRQSKDAEAWRKFCKQVGIEPIKGHGARHLFATMLAENGVAPQTAEALLGDTKAMTAYYTHLSLKTSQKAIAELERPEEITKMLEHTDLI